MKRKEKIHRMIIQNISINLPLLPMLEFDLCFVPLHLQDPPASRTHVSFYVAWSKGQPVQTKYGRRNNERLLL